MKKTMTDYPFINEKLTTVVLDNGLTLYLINKEGFKTYYASLGVLYGSNNNTFIPYGHTEFETFPHGIAHFLEHQLFEKEDNDAALIFNKYGIDSNAYTSFLETNYYITGTSNLEIGIELLFDFVQSGYFSNEHVEKERNVIASEIKMYLDSPGSRLYDGICNNLFVVDNLKYDIAGTIESIQQITCEMLEKAYKTYYQPHNMYFCLVGDFDLDNIINLISDNQKKKQFLPPFEIQSRYPVEPRQLNLKSSKIEMDIVYPIVAIGLKLPGFEEEPMLIQNMFKIILYALLGSSSPTHQVLLDRELINGGFSCTSTITPYSSFLKIQANTLKVDEFVSFIKGILTNINENTLSEEIIERYKKNIFGQIIKVFNKVESIASLFMDFKFAGCNFFDYQKQLNDLSYDDFKKLFEYFKEENITTFVIENKNE